MGFRPIVVFSLGLIFLSCGDYIEKCIDCTILGWREWSDCQGSCGINATQVRVKSICFDTEVVKLEPFTREHVIEYCNLTENTNLKETRSCPKCSDGAYGITTGRNFVKCSDSPCVHGTCTDTQHGFQCACPPDYTGQECGTQLTTTTISTRTKRTTTSKPTTSTAKPTTSTAKPTTISTAKPTTTTKRTTSTAKPTTSTAKPPTTPPTTILATLLSTFRTRCSSNPCLRGSCFDTTMGYSCICEPSYTGHDCDTLLETNTSALYELPDWFPYMEYALLTMITMTVLMAAGCVCLKCCQLCGCDSSDDEEENKRMQRSTKPLSRFPCPRPRKPSSIEF